MCGIAGIINKSNKDKKLYSVLKNKWLVIPKKKELKIDFDDIRSKAEGYVGSINTLKELMSLGRYKKVIQMIESIKTKLKRMRQSGLERGGEFSVENLAFKALRRSPFIATISKMKDDAYDKLMTMEGKRVPRKKGQHRGSSSHSDLYTDENPKGTIKGLKFATVKDAKSSVSKIKGSGKTHAHKIQAAVAMEQRAKEMGKKSQAAVYRAFINKMKKKTKKKNEGFFGLPAGVIPSPSRKAVKKNKTDSLSGYVQVKEHDCGCKDVYELTELNEKKWSLKYKRSIDCNNPKGFSQKAHCAGKKKKESKEYTFGPDWIPTNLAQRKKMKRIHQKLNRSIRENITIPVKIGDTILTGRFKYKKIGVNKEKNK